MDFDFKAYNGITEWLKESEHKVFRMWVYKKMFTPYEMEHKFVDESVYENNDCEYVIFTKIIPLADNDYLLGYISVEGYDYNEIAERSENKKYESYVKLSEITLAYSESDNIDFTETA